MTRRAAVSALLASCAGVPASAAASVRVPPFSQAPLGRGVPAGWRHETLPKVERGNAFEIVADHGVPVLHVRSSASASTLVAAMGEAGAASGERLRWRWKVSKALPGTDLASKQGDDYAARLYVLFDLPLDRLGLGQRLGIQAMRAISGRDVPAAAICYVWGNRQPAGSIGWNPFTDRVRMVFVESGDAHAGQWRAAQRDLRLDWQEAFPGPMPPISALAVSADTDNTGDSVEAWFGDVLLTAAG